MLSFSLCVTSTRSCRSKMVALITVLELALLLLSPSTVTAASAQRLRSPSLSLLLDNCPNETIIQPCKCKQESYEILCGSGITKSIDLRYLFKDASPLVDVTDRPNGAAPAGGSAAPSQYRYSHLVFENSPVDKLVARSFDPFTFIAITIRHHYYLTTFEENAFFPTNQLTTTVKFDSNTKLGSNSESVHSLFGTIKSFVNLEILLIHNCGLLFVPPGAFGLATQQHIRRISLIGNSIQVVQPSAFIRLPSLRYLALSHNKIDRIEPGAIDLITTVCNTGQYAKYEKTYYFIDLSNNQIGPDSLQPGSISVDCSTELNLSNNSMTYLPQPVFRPLFAHFVKILLIGNQVDCVNCAMAWLLKGRYCPLYNSTLRYHSLVESACDSIMLASFVERCPQFADRKGKVTTSSSSQDGQSNSSSAELVSAYPDELLESDHSLLHCPQDGPSAGSMAQLATPSMSAYPLAALVLIIVTLIAT